jgi:type IV pilus assembly protein PilA
MNSIKCDQCGFVGWADAETCKKCGATLGHPADNSYEAPQGYAAYNQYNNPGVSDGDLKKGLAVFALVLGILNIFTLGLLGVGAILGIVVSVVALTKIKAKPYEYGGKSLATAGLVTSILSIVIVVPIGIIAAIAIPNLLASRMAANEGSAMASMRKIHSAEATFQATHETFGTLDELAEARLIDPDLASGRRRGYKFKITITPAGPSYPVGFEAVGVPLDYGSSGRRSFLIDETGVIRTANNRGGDPSRSDPPLDSSGEYSSDSPAPRRANPSVDY